MDKLNGMPGDGQAPLSSQLNALCAVYALSMVLGLINYKSATQQQHATLERPEHQQQLKLGQQQLTCSVEQWPRVA